MPETTYQVNGLTCDHCVRAVTQELTRLPGVSEVRVDLRPGAPSPVAVVCAAPLPAQAVSDALDEAGDYTLVTS